MNKIIQKQAQITIRRLREALQKRDVNEQYCATLYAELLDAEDARLISGDWRKQVDVTHVEQIVSLNIDFLTQRWDQKFEQLSRILAFGDHLVYEEVLLVLSLRSGLQSIARFLPSEYEAKLAELDFYLVASLKQNARIYDQCRGKGKWGIVKHIPKHWWWRGSMSTTA